MFFLNALGSFPSSYVFALACDFVRDHFDESNMRYRIKKETKDLLLLKQNLNY